MTSWNPMQYMQFLDHRLRPALDLLERIQIDNPSVIYDLGCGTGTATQCLKKRWPQACVIGIDSSSSMIAQAMAQEKNGISWESADISTWTPKKKPALLYSNAALHWIDNHEIYLPYLIRLLPRDGVLAIQMPRNFKKPSHTTIFDTIRAHDWSTFLLPLVRECPTHPPEFYYDLLRPLVTRIDVWETIYYQVMDGTNPIVEFTKGSFLRPILTALNTTEAALFLEEYSDRVAPHYPQRPDGTTLFPFQRLFMLITK